MTASIISDFTKRKTLAWAAFWKLQKIWRSSSISLATKIKLFNTTCVKVLLYGCVFYSLVFFDERVTCLASTRPVTALCVCVGCIICA